MPGGGKFGRSTSMVFAFGADGSLDLPSIDDEVGPVLDMSPADLHRRVAGVQDRELLATALLMERAEGPERGLWILDIHLGPHSRREGPHEAALGCERNQFGSRERLAIAGPFDVAPAPESSVELERHGPGFRAFDEHALALEHDGPFAGGTFESVEQVVVEPGIRRRLVEGDLTRRTTRRIPCCPRGPYPRPGRTACGRSRRISRVPARACPAW